MPGVMGVGSELLAWADNNDDDGGDGDDVY